MDNNIAIRVENVSKTFKLPHEKHTSVKSAFINLFRTHKKGYEIQHALKDVSFEVKKGEFFGIVGRNGSGKSTLLKLIAGIYTPTKGQIHVNGKLTPFIELGVGFNPELTARENVYLNGALLGFSRKEMNRMYKDIVEFAELERFMDQKLKNYSSGMQVRLAFSIAIRVPSDILLIDEVLAVGDAAFQQKCIRVFENYKEQKRTVVIVTHDMGVVERFCDRAMLIKDGEVIKIGSPYRVAQMYSDLNKETYVAEKQKKEAEKNRKQNLKIRVLGKETRKPKVRFNQGDTALIELSWKNPSVKNAGVAIMRQSGEYVFGPNTIQDKYILKNPNKLYYEVKLDLGPGEYYLKAGLFGEKEDQVIEFVDDGPSIIVEKSSGPAWGGIAFLEHSWWS
jgi:ABC-2 type transport system ATP-binding protein